MSNVPDMQKPLVTVGVASYNNGEYIRETLESIRQQTYENIELIIVDDASRDNSVAVIQQWLNDFPEVKAQFVGYSENKGVCRVFNEVILRGAGELVCIIGSDDVYLPDKLETQVPLLLNAPPEVGVITSAIEFMDSNGNKIPQPDDFAIPHPEDAYLTLLKSCVIAAMSVLVRRSCYDKVGLYDESLPFEDWDMWLRLAKEYRFIYSHKVSARYRRHQNAAFSKRRLQIEEGSLTLLAKQRGYSPAADELIKVQTRLRAELLYQLGSTQAVHWLQVRWHDDRSWQSYLLYRLAKAGISGTTVVKWQRLLGR